METYHIDTLSEFECLLTYVSVNKYSKPSIKIERGAYVLAFNAHESFVITMDKFSKDARDRIYNWVQELKTFQDEKPEHLIFGKNELTNIVSCEVCDSTVTLFIEKDGEITQQNIPNRFWIVSSKQFDASWQELEGKLNYKYIKYYDDQREYYTDRNLYKQADIYYVSDAKESAMILNGFTYYKGMKVDEVSALFFDIEATGLAHDDKSKVLLISNTFVKNGVVTRKLFAYSDYEKEKDLFIAWCDWVRDVNPSIVSGHNIFGYDLPYLGYCAKKAKTTLNLGRDASKLRFDKYTSKFRKDGSQDYDYNRAHIFGREIVDTMFLAYHFDFGRKYVSYGLKAIIDTEKLQVEGRVFYDASLINKNYLIPEEWEKIKTYAMHDADDAYSLYKLMIPAYFYLTPSIPKSFQVINYSGTGSQINAFLVRSYLQNGHSLPKACPKLDYEGAISDGYPGTYKNVFKVDVASLYPSIMLQYQVHDLLKDPKKNFLKMVQYFTRERLLNKQKAKDTGDRYYKDLEQAQKIVINSAYGMLGSVGLLFNSPPNAAFVTEKGREILSKAVFWATGKEYIFE